MTTPEDERRVGARPLPPLSSGDLLAGRFRIERFVGEGSMGRVYEAQDLELRQQVAVRVVRPELANDEKALQRFRREVRLAGLVTHHNVCRLFDVFHHESAEGPALTFVSMELLAGETLADRLARTGRLPSAEALPLLRQIVSALAAAHEAGVVHRDFRSANVALVPGTEGSLRAVVADFGLARASSAADSASTALSDTGLRTASPAYLSPEQVEGREATPASDVYALGVVMYEMATGHQPFEADTPVAAAAKRLTEDPVPPRARVPEVDRRWEAVILRCLARQPRDRFSSADEVLRALTGEGSAAPRRPLAKALVGGGLALSLVVSVVVARRAASPPRTPPTTLAGPVAKARRTVAVLGFKNLSGRPETAWISTALAEMLAMELAAGEEVRTIPGENVTRTKVELSLPEADSFARDTLARVRANLGADVVVLGSYFAVGGMGGGRVRLDLRLQDTRAGETIATLSDTGTEPELPDLVTRAGARLRQKLGVSAAESRRGDLLSANVEATRLYSEGLSRLRRFDALAARERLEKAVAADPASPLAHAALAEAWAALGYDGRAQKEARRAFEMAAGLPRGERLAVEGRYHEFTADWEKAVEIYVVLFSFYPDDLEHGLRLAGAQTAAGRGRDALHTVLDLRRLPAPGPDDPRVDLAEARAAESLSDFRRELAAAQGAARKAESQGARLLVAEARLLEWWALRNLGEFDRALAASDEARRVFEAVGDQGGVARSLNATATVLRQRGDFAGARRLDEESLGVFRRIGDKRRASWALNNVGHALFDDGDLERTRAVFGESLALCRETGDKDGLARALINSGRVHRDQGDLRRASEMFTESIALARQGGNRRLLSRALNILGSLEEAKGELSRAEAHFAEALGLSHQIEDKVGSAWALHYLSVVLVARGRLIEARKASDESVALFRQYEKRSAAFALSGLGEVVLAQDDLPGARKAHEEALRIRGEVGDSWNALWSRLALASLAVEEGRPAEAEGPARECAAKFRKQKARDREALALGVLARSLLAQGKRPRAQAFAEDGLAAARGTECPWVRLPLAVIAARAQAASGRGSAAGETLAAVAADAAKLGHVLLEGEARLALAEVRSASGDPAIGRAQLADLEREARSRGLLLLARKAARR